MCRFTKLVDLAWYSCVLFLQPCAYVCRHSNRLSCICQCCDVNVNTSITCSSSYFGSTLEMCVECFYGHLNAL